jgi:hypothetical protein
MILVNTPFEIRENVVPDKYTDKFMDRKTPSPLGSGQRALVRDRFRSESFAPFFVTGPISSCFQCTICVESNASLPNSTAHSSSTSSMALNPS